jgi:hypothetical protein
MAVAPGNGPLPLHMKSNFRRIRIGLIGDNSPSKQICFFPALKHSRGVAVMVMNLALPLEHFEGIRLAHCRRKTYLLARGIISHQSNML